MNEGIKLTHISIVAFVILVALMAVTGCTTQQQTTPVTTPASLKGTWTLTSGLVGTELRNPITTTTITATFSDSGTVSGSSGCNNYVATYEVGRENAFDIGKLAYSKRICDSPAGINDQETIYLSNLAAATTYAINGDVLTFSDSMGKTILTYKRSDSLVTPLPIAGITWNLDHYRNVTGSDVPVIQNTEVTALFGPIGTINGTAGCNSYNGAYTTSGSNGISIGPLATTMMYCGEPGVMDQETAYLTHLRAVSSYEVTDDGILNLNNATGTPILVYSI